MNNNNERMPAVSKTVRSMPPLQRFLTSDIDEHARNMQGWQVRYDQLSPGAFEGELIEFRSGWMQLARDRSNQAMIKSGEAWDGAITFSLPLSAHGPVYCAGHPIHDPSLLVAHGRNLPELHTPQHLDLLSVAIDEHVLQHILERQGSPFELPIFPSVTVWATHRCNRHSRPCSTHWQGASKSVTRCSGMTRSVAASAIR